MIITVNLQQILNKLKSQAQTITGVTNIMRTVRIKLYKFDELSHYAKLIAINHEVRKFNSYFFIHNEITLEHKLAAMKRLIAYEFYFTANGKKY